MPIVLGSTPRPFTQTTPFGEVPNDLIETVNSEKLAELAEQISKMGLDLAVNKSGDEETLAELVRQFRAGVGAMWLYLWRQLDKDLAKAYSVSESFPRCMYYSLCTRTLLPQKYFRVCGTVDRGYGGLVTQLANIPMSGTPLRDRMLQEWGMKSWREHVDRVWKTKNQLMEKEKEYREAANVILQVGIGLGGMIVGIVGLILGIVGLVIGNVNPLHFVTSPVNNNSHSYPSPILQPPVTLENDQSSTLLHVANPTTNPHSMLPTQVIPATHPDLAR